MLARRALSALGGPLCDTCDTLQQIDFERDEPTPLRGTLALRLGPSWGFGARPGSGNRTILRDRESRALVEIMRKHASTFSDWGFDGTSFWVELDAQARNPWSYLMRELFEQLDAPSEQVQLAMAPLVVRMRAVSRNSSSPAALQTRAWN